MIAQSANSTITVTANGTIDSGTTLNIDGTSPAGIEAGYDGGTTATPNAAVFGTVTVNDFANITAAAGAGIDAYNYGNGDVSVNDNYGSGAVASTSVSGAVLGIEAQALSGGTGDVTVNVGTNAQHIDFKCSRPRSTASWLFSLDTGNIAVTTSTGDVITVRKRSGSRQSMMRQPIAPSANSSITVTAAGTINSGPNLDSNGNPPGGIVAGYYPNNTASTDTNVAGNVSVTSDATINAARGLGIDAFNFGTGNSTVTTGVNSSITASGPKETINGISVPIGIAAYALDGGNASITNAGSVTVATGIALQAQATAEGTVTIANSGSVSGGENGIDAISADGAITIGSSGSVTSTGADGIDATSAAGDITITPAGSVSGAGNGIFATQNGDGNVTISVGSGATLTGTAQFGIFALSLGSGDLSVSTATGDTVNSGSAGIVAENQATTISSGAGSNISVTAEGRINSGTSLTTAGNRPAGILAGYNANGLPEPNVTGSVLVDNFADIVALAGDGIRAFNFGAGNVTVTDEAGTTIQTTGANGQYGIEGYSAGAGSISVTMSAGDVVESASAGINADNQATAIAQSVNSISR